MISACASYSPAFHIMYSAYKLNKQGDNIQPWHTTFPIWNQCIVPCSVLTVASWPAYTFSVVWYSHLFQNFPQFFAIHTVKSFGVVNKAEVDVFLELSCFFNDLMDVGNLIGCVEDDGRRQWHPTPVLLPGKSHGRRSLVGCSPWGR